MNKLGPAIFCFALLCVASLFIFPKNGPVIFLVGCAVIATATLAWGIYSLIDRRWSGLFFLLLGIVEFILLSPALHHE